MASRSISTTSARRRSRSSSSFASNKPSSREARFRPARTRTRQRGGGPVGPPSHRRLISVRDEGALAVDALIVGVAAVRRGRAQLVLVGAAARRGHAAQRSSVVLAAEAVAALVARLAIGAVALAR